jgi:elongation factor G
MKKYEVENIRNIGLFGHGSDGKTLLADAILFDTKMTNRMGRVDDGSSLLDFEPEEVERQISISATTAYYEWDKHRVVLVDTPGDANFIYDAKTCMQVVEGGIIVIGANSGVKVQTEAVWHEANTLRLARIIFISKMDVDRARFAETLNDIRENLNELQPLPLQIPIGQEKDFQGVIDLLSNKAYLYEGDGSGKYREEAIPAELAGEAEQQRVKTVETLVEMDDELMEKYLEGEELSLADLHGCLKKGVAAGTFAPVVCGSSDRNIGIQPLLNLINTCLPSPAEVGPKAGTNPKTGEEETREATEDAPFCASVFKTIADPFAGRLTLFRVYSGSISADTTLYNANKEGKERVGQIFMLQGKKQEPVGFAGPGDIVAVAKLKETTTGDTLCDEKAPIIFPSPPLPPAIMSYAIKPKAKGDEEKIATSLQKLMEEDPTINISRDAQTKEIILSGMGQVHVDVVLEKLKRKFGVEVELEAPKVPYQETVKKPAQGVIYRHKKQTGGRGQFAEVHFDVTPLERGKGFEFENALTGMNVPRSFVPAVEKGIAEAMTSGVLAGYPVVDVKVRFYDGKSHEVDSSEMAFKIAAIMGFKKGARDASPVLLEPIIKMEVIVGEEHVGDIIGDLNGRRGKILGVESRGHDQIVKAQVPMAEVLRYAPDLTSMTGGKGSFTLEFSHYEEVPPNVSERIVAEAKKEKEEE